MDDFRIYNRALSASEITMLSNGEEPRNPNMVPFKRDGTPSGKNRTIYDLRKVRLIKKASA